MCMWCGYNSLGLEVEFRWQTGLGFGEMQDIWREKVKRNENITEQ